MERATGWVCVYILVFVSGLIERVSNFEYLGARIEANGKSTPEIRRRLAMATTGLKNDFYLERTMQKKT